jgi:dihydrodipicolinate synthase/N-acetylneuraminate lyase
MVAQICFQNCLKPVLKHLKQKDLEKINTYHQIVMRISKDIYALEGGSYSYLKGMKAAAASMGLCENKLVPPLKAGDENFYKTIEKKTVEIQKELDALL